MLRIIPILLFSLFFMANGYAESEHTILTKDLTFSNPLKVIKPGDRLIFENDDTVVHNVVSATVGFQFDLGAFKPGMSKSLVFKETGVVDIECTIHPGMKMTLFIFNRSN